MFKRTRTIEHDTYLGQRVVEHDAPVVNAAKVIVSTVVVLPVIAAAAIIVIVILATIIAQAAGAGVLGILALVGGVIYAQQRDSANQARMARERRAAADIMALPIIRTPPTSSNED